MRLLDINKLRREISHVHVKTSPKRRDGRKSSKVVVFQVAVSGNIDRNGRGMGGVKWKSQRRRLKMDLGV